MIKISILCLFLLWASLIIGIIAENQTTNLANEFTEKEQYLKRGFDWISEKFLKIVETFLPNAQNQKSNAVEGRKHKKKKVKLNKYIFPLIVGFLLIKSVLLPLALKALAVLSGTGVLLSLLSLVLSAIIGLRSVLGGQSAGPLAAPFQSKVDLINLPLAKYKRKDMLDYVDQLEEESPYKYYAERLHGIRS